MYVIDTPNIATPTRNVNPMLGAITRTHTTSHDSYNSRHNSEKIVPSVAHDKKKTNSPQRIGLPINNIMNCCDHAYAGRAARPE